MTGPQFVAAVAVVLVALFCSIEGKMTVLYYGSYPNSGPDPIGKWVTSVIGQKNDRCPGKALQQGMEYPVIELDGARWRLFWWYQANTTWPASVTDVLKDNYGDCDVDFPYCFSRLPDALQEDGAEILANDSAGTVYRWKFSSSSSNNVAHAAWGAFHDGIESTIRKQNVWTPRVVQGKTPKQQDSFQYKDVFGVKSFMLDDDNCDCDSTLSMGHAMCHADQHAFQEAIFGVDLLYHEEPCAARLHVPRPTNGLSIFFKDSDDCIDAGCPDGSRCLDGINSFTCTGN